MKIIYLNEEFVAVNEKDQPIYFLKSETTVPTRKKYVIEDGEKRTLGHIRRMRYNFGMYDLPRYFVEMNGRKEITIMKDMEQFRSKYTIEGENITLQGEFLGDHLTVLMANQEIADVTIKKIEGSFSFDMNIKDIALKELILGFVFAIALIYQDEKHTSRA